jgi:voltage-gated potassium channel
MNDKNTFKEKLAEVFDDDLTTRSPEWKNYVDYVIIGMIVLSTVAVFLETLPLSDGFRRCLHVFDWIVLIFFTVEVSLRIWAADQIDDKYKGFGGRVRYCLTFYGLVDFLATYPVWLGIAFPALIPVTVIQLFRVLRVARLFRVFHYLKAYRFLGDAIGSKKKEIWVSFQFITVITVILSFLLYLVERTANHGMMDNGWKSIVWAFAKYLGDPGKVADMPLATPAGHVLAFLVGLMGIAFFAVPIGLLSSGFSEAIEKNTRAAELEEFRKKMKKEFRHRRNPSFREYLDSMPDGGGERFKTVNVVPQRVPVSKLQVRQGMTLDDVIETCNKFKEFRLKNLAAAKSEEELTPERFVVEHFPLNTDYGCYIPRKSGVTVVCPTSQDEVGIGWFTYYLAKMGGFNYISREIGEPDSFYNLSAESSTEQKTNREAFLHDLQESSASGWVIVFAEHTKNSVNTADFHFANTLKDGTASTVVDMEEYKHFTDSFSALMKAEFSLETSVPSQRYPLLKKNVGYYVREKHPETNVFVLRPSSQLMNFNPQRLAVAWRMALLISEHFDDGRGMTDADWTDLKATGAAGY